MDQVVTGLVGNYSIKLQLIKIHTPDTSCYVIRVRVDGSQRKTILWTSHLFTFRILNIPEESGK